MLKGTSSELEVTQLKNSNWKQNLFVIFDKGSTMIGLVLLFVILSIVTTDFLTVDNLINVTRQATVLCIMAVAMTFIIITGGIDLSAGSQIAVSGVVVSGLIVAGVPIPLAVLLAIMVGGVIGLFMGTIVSTQKIPPFIVTLGMTTILSGLAFVYTQGNPIAVSDAAFRALGRGYIGPIPIPVIIMVIVVVIGHILLTHTRFGRYVYMIGDNEEAARLCGINVNLVKTGVYVLGGAVMAIAGIILASRLSTGSPNSGTGSELDAIAAVVLGGTNLFGGEGKIIGTLMGVAIISILNNGLNLLDVSSYNQLMIKGVVILLAVWLNSIKARKKMSV
ncbi:ribose ABC transporter permease [Brevibacillus reuszeri]|uniref:Ribose ABC transporter permease n=2 Tax=Brevibacillus reuszeri TaxID=54915 RepID=A0ABQ0TZ57_9BACL|nr:ribose ABC transporter permease [Brevibacillus reuszeri]MED1861790.1 ribose ABC transporter permease [Brevibacillus reuszeri]GED72969.1 ribose ABC transporter permease [Brevibacillus reuszeri]